MSVYLIDYENVHASGLAGVENCGIEDEIILLYGNDTSTIPMELHIQIANSKGKVQYHKIERTGKNYLDFQLSTIAGFLVGTTRQTEFVIVSRDSGYDAVLDYWNDERLADRVVHFCRRASIAEAEETKNREEKDSRKRRQGKKNGKKLPAVSSQQLPNVVEEKKKQVPAEVKPRGGKKGKNQGRKAEEQETVVSVEQTAQEPAQESVRETEQEQRSERQSAQQERQEQKPAGQQSQEQELSKQQAEVADQTASEKQEKKQPNKQTKKKNETKGRGKKKQESSQKEEKGAEGRKSGQEDTKIEENAAEEEQPQAVQPKIIQPKIAQPKIHVQEFPDPEQERREPVEITESVKKKIRVAVKGLELKPTDYTKIYKLCKNVQDKQELYQNLVHSLKQEKGSQVYKAIVGIIF